MNFLAHIYLSGDDEMITIGNFVADAIRGKSYKKMSTKLQVGVLLHRHIDTFTDSHPIVRQSTKRLHKNYSHYSGVIVDILYDHFLAKNWKKYSDVPLDTYVADFYETLKLHFDQLPSRFQRLMPFMIADNWLLSYAEIDGIQRVLNGMNRRTDYKSGMDNATQELKTFYAEFEAEFTEFFEQLIKSAETKLAELKIQFEI